MQKESKSFGFVQNTTTTTEMVKQNTTQFNITQHNITPDTTFQYNRHTTQLTCRHNTTIKKQRRRAGRSAEPCVWCWLFLIKLKVYCVDRQGGGLRLRDTGS